MENISLLMHCHASVELQCGHDDEVVENMNANLLEFVRNTLQCGHDDEVVENEAHPSRPSDILQHFNAATTMKSWRTTGLSISGTTINGLQCGHDDEVVENLVVEAAFLQPVRTSMRPRR